MNETNFGYVKEQVVNGISTFKHIFHKEPTDIHFTKDQETQLMDISRNDVGDELLKTYILEGLRFTFPTFLGLYVHWDSDEFYITREDLKIVHSDYEFKEVK
jgi:hypothetical protein